jgi:hypothetical protein
MDGGNRLQPSDVVDDKCCWTVAGCGSMLCCCVAFLWSTPMTTCYVVFLNPTKIRLMAHILMAHIPLSFPRIIIITDHDRYS